MSRKINANGKDAETVSAIMELMLGWNTIEAEAKRQFPNASKEELYQICKGAMNHALGRK